MYTLIHTCIRQQIYKHFVQITLQIVSRLKFKKHHIDCQHVFLLYVEAYNHTNVQKQTRTRRINTEEKNHRWWNSLY